MQELLDGRARANQQRERQSDAYDAAPNPLRECQSLVTWDKMFGGADAQVGCTADGTLVRGRFIDGGLKQVVTETVNPRDSSHTFTLKSQNIKLVVDKQGRLLSYSNGDNLYSFDPAKQKFQTSQLPELDLFGNAANSPPKPTSKDLGDGLTVSNIKDNGGYTYRLPDGLTLSFDEYSQLTQISKANSFNYEMGASRHLTQEDPNLPKDHRLRNPDAIKIDADAAIFLSMNESKLYPIARIQAQQDFTKHMNEMPEAKRVEYAKALQAEIDKVEAHKNFYYRRRLDYTVGKDGKLEAIDVAFGSYVPYFTVAVEGGRIWHK